MTVCQPTFEDPDFSSLRTQQLTFKLFGLHLSHSKAPTLHNFIFKKLGLDWKYEVLETDDVDEITKTLQSDFTIGSAVTMPNKITMTQHVDHIDNGAKAVGAINTVYSRKDTESGLIKLIGTNTDTIGIRDAFYFNSPDIVQSSKSQGLPGLVYGGGGACRSAVYALHEFMNCSIIYIINRFDHEIDQLKVAMSNGGFKGKIIQIKSIQQAIDIEIKPKLLVLTVPDFDPITSEEKLAKSILDVFINLTDKGSVLEMCYHPLPTTKLYNEFIQNNWSVISGVEAMIYQGIAQQVLWTGYKIDELPVKQVIEHVYNSTLN